MDRSDLIVAVASRLGNRRLVWAGIRGDDVEPLSDLPQLEGAFSLISRYQRRSDVRSESYETLSGVRVDPEVWDMDDHLDAPATVDFRHALLRALSSRTALLTYRPSQFLSSVLFARHDLCLPLGLAGAFQSAFEHKPWVETEIKTLGLPRIPWTYIADEDQFSASTLFDGGPLMLRRSRTSGGEGLVRVDRPEDVAEHWPHVAEAFVSVAPYVSGTPVNVGATVWHDGVSVHHASLQLIGIPHVVTREFGYCGNDFGGGRDLDNAVLDRIDESTRRIGDWLRRHGYLGSFGVDFIVRDGVPLFTEINPRFQGSTHASAQLDIEAGRSCLLTEHVAAWLGVDAPPPRPMRELMAETPDFSHLVVHWIGDRPQRLDSSTLQQRAWSDPATVRVELAPGADILCEPGAAVLRWTARRRMTSTGFALMPDLSDVNATLVTPTDPTED